jgi:hypothetical protein
MPVVSVVLVVGDGEAGTDETPVGGDDVLDPPHPETASNATVATTMETSLRMSAAYCGVVRKNPVDAGDRPTAPPLDGLA